MPDSWQLMTQLRSAGFAATISGAGPCVLVLHSGDTEEDLRQMAASEWLASGRWKLVATQVDTEGVIISKKGEVLVFHSFWRRHHGRAGTYCLRLA